MAKSSWDLGPGGDAGTEAEAEQPTTPKPAPEPAIEYPKNYKPPLQTGNKINAESRRLDLMTDEELSALHKWPTAAARWEPDMLSAQELDDAPIKVARQERNLALAAPPAAPPEEAKPHNPFTADRPIDDELEKSDAANPFSISGGKPKSSKSTLSGPSMDAQIVVVKDGDTFDAIVDGTRRTFRIAHIDAPELGPGGMGGVSKNALEKMLRSGQVRLYNLQQMADGRIAADVAVGDTNVGAWMKQNGYASNWLGLPDWWPHGNEIRTVKRLMAGDPEDLAKFEELLRISREWGRRVSLTRTFRPSKEMMDAFNEQAAGLEKYVTPFKQPRTTAQVRTLPGQSPQIAMPPTAKGPVEQETPQYYDKPTGRQEYAQWAKTLWPKERELYSQLKNAIDAYEKMAPQLGGRKWLMQQKGYVDNQRLLAKFMHMTTQRMRQIPPQQIEEKYGPRRRSRRRRADLITEDGLNALGAIA